MKSSKKDTKYLVIRDTREQEGWDFPCSTSCEGTVVKKLRTGDYTLRGYETVFVIERKGSAGEFAKNVVQKRFEAELKRLEAFAHPFIVLEFTLGDLKKFPEGSGIPESRRKKLRVTPQYLLLRLNEFMVRYKTKIVFAGPYGREFSSSLFKRISENVPCPTDTTAS